MIATLIELDVGTQFDVVDILRKGGRELLDIGVLANDNHDDLEPLRTVLEFDSKIGVVGPLLVEIQTHQSSRYAFPFDTRQEHILHARRYQQSSHTPQSLANVVDSARNRNCTPAYAQVRYRTRAYEALESATFLSNIYYRVAVQQ